MIRITIDVVIHDEQALLVDAKRLHAEMWGDDDEPRTTGDWLFEALVASTPGPMPNGIEIHDWTTEEV